MALTVTLERAGQTAERVAFRYAVQNESTEAVMVLDRRWDAARDAMDRDWVEVDLAGTGCVLTRAHVVPPRNVRVSEPRLPYGRVVDPGERSESVIELALPIEERGTLDAALDLGPVRGDAGLAMIDAVVLRVGWIPMPSVDALPPASQRELVIDGERLRWLSAGRLAASQRVAQSEPVAVTLVGRRRGPLA